MQVRETSPVTDEDVEMKEESQEEVIEEQTGCETIINQIRKDEFGIGVQLSEEGQRLMKVSFFMIQVSHSYDGC